MAIEKTEEKKLLIFEKKVLGKFLDLLGTEKQENGEQKIMRNWKGCSEKIYNKCNQEPKTGHAMQGQNHLIRMIMDENPAGKRPKLRWEDVTGKNVEVLNEYQCYSKIIDQKPI